MIVTRTARRHAVAAPVVAALLLATVGCTSSGDDDPSPSVTPTTARPAAHAVAASFAVPVHEPTGPNPPRAGRSGDTTVVVYAGVARALTRQGVSRWTFALPTNNRDPYSLDAVVDGGVTVLTWTVGTHTRIRAVDTGTGRVRWTGDADFAYVQAGVVLTTVCDDDRNRCTITALSTSTGKPRWARTVAGSAYVRQAGSDLTVPVAAPTWSSAIVEIYRSLDSTRSRLVALDLATGRSRDLAVPPGVLFRAGNIVAGVPRDRDVSDGCTGRVVAADVTTGKQVWTRSLATTSFSSSDGPACDDLSPLQVSPRSISLRPGDGHPVVVDLSNGREVWNDPRFTGTVVSRYPSGASTVTLIRSDAPGGVLSAVGDDGVVLWSRSAALDQDTQALVQGRLVLGLITCADQCPVVNPRTGKTVGRVGSGRIVGSGDDWVATWDRAADVVRVYDVRA